MRFDVLTIFPGMFDGPLDESILRRAREASLLDVHVHDLRQWATDRHHKVDDYPFGGGPGMVMKPEPLFAAVEAIQPLAEPPATVVLLTPQGRPLDRVLAAELAAVPRLLLICGRYEGVDERVREHLVELEVSAGDVVLSGGELPALMLIDAVTRLLPGGLGGGEGSLGRGVVRAVAARIPALHAPGRVPRLGGAGGAALREPRRDRALAASPAVAAHAPASPRPARGGRAERRGARLDRRVRRPGGWRPRRYRRAPLD